MRRLTLTLAAVLTLHAAPARAQSLLITALTVEDLAFAPASGRLYAVLPAGQGGPETAVAELNPANGAIVTRVAIADGPGGGATQLVVSDDGATLYVGVDGGRRVRRYGLPAFTPGAEFVLGTSAFGDPLTVRNLAIAPGSSSTLVVSQAAQFLATELAVYDNGVARPQRVYGTTAWFVSASLVFDPELQTRSRLVATGLQVDVAQYERLGGQVTAIESGVGYETSGEVFDFLTRQVNGTCQAFGTAVPMTGTSTVVYFGSGTVMTCDVSRYVVTGSLQIPGLTGGFRGAVLTGTGRFALVDTSRRLLVADGFSAPLPPLAPPSPGPTWFPGASVAAQATLTGCTRCRAGDLFVAQGAVVNLRGDLVEVKAAIVLPNGATVPATALGVSHLELKNLYRDVGGPLLQVVLPAGLPPGLWAFEMALIDPVSGAVMSRSSVPFEVLP